MEFFNNAVTVLQTLVVALGAFGEQSIFWKGMAMITLVRMLMCGKVTHKNLIDSSLYSVKKVLTHIRNRIYNIYEIGY